MKKIDKVFNKIKKWCLKPLRNVLLSLAILLAVMLALLHLPVVQQQLLRSISNYLCQTTHYHIKCDAFRITWLRHIALEGLTVTDPQDKPLFTIHACKSRLNLLSLLLLKPNMIDSVSLTGGELYLEKDKEQAFNMATFYAKAILPFVPKEDSGLYINKIQLHGINLCYHDPINRQAVKIENIHLSISHFLSSSGRYSGHLTNCSYQETSALPLVWKNLITQFSITSHSIMLKDCHLITNHSNLQGDFILKNTKQLPLVANKENILLKAIFHKTVLSSIELTKFLDFFKGSHTLYKLDGAVSLTPHAVAWKNCTLAFGDSYLESTGCYNGIDADVLVKAGKVYMQDLEQKPAICPTQLQYIGITNSTFVGNTQKAKLTGDITTNIGDIQTDLVLRDVGKPTQDLTGTLTLHKLTMDAVLPALPIKSLSGKVVIKKAQGGRLNTLDAVAHLTEIATNHYNYKQVEASCMAANAIVSFKLNSKDPSAKLAIAGSYHMAKGLQADGIIEKVRLEKLGFVREPLSVHTKFSLKIRDILHKRPRGEVVLNQCTIQGLEKTITCKQVALHAIEHANKDVLTLTSPLIDCRLQGIFTLHDLVHHIKHLIARFKNPVGGWATSLTGLHLDYAINCKKIDSISNWFLDDLYIPPATTFSGHFAYNRDYDFSFHLPATSTVRFKRFRLDKIKIDLNVGHLMNEQQRLIRLYIASDHQDWHQTFQTDHLYLQLLMDKDKFTISNKVSHHDGALSLACSGALIDDVIRVDLLPSSLTIKEKVWTIQTECSSFMSKSRIAIGNLSIKSGQEAICVGGHLTQSATKNPLQCTIRHLALNYPSAVGPIKGILDTKLIVHRQKDQFIATGRLSLQEATIQDYAVGNLSTKVGWNLLENKLVLKGMLQKEGKQLLQIDGCYHLLKSSDNLSLSTTFDQMDLDLLNPLFAAVCSDIHGKLSGQFHLTGKLTAPKLNGKGAIDQGTFKINYLNTAYQVAGAIKIRDNRLYVHQLALRDEAAGHATLSGHMVLQNGFSLMLTGHMETFHLLHTTRMDNPDFYGDVYATGALQMQGSIYDLLLKMKVTTDKGTFTIVAHDKEDIENATKLVEFVYNKAKKQPDNIPDHEDKSAIKLILDLTIQPTIKAQVLFGSYNNKDDVLEGQGTGAIQIEVGTNRKPYVMGGYLFQSGTYTVSVYNLIQKTFTISPNSQVNFNGYPQEGIAHIDASYKQTASISELYPQSNDKRPIPVEIALSAYGSLAHPHIAYHLFFPVKSMDFDLNTALEECASKAVLDKVYLNKQILSLLIAKKVYNEKQIDGWDALRNSLNDFLSQRIQNWVSKIDDHLEIETDLGINQPERQKENIFQKTSIKVSYLLLSERLKLSSTVGGRSRFINDWEIAYRISRAHNMHAKLYQQPFHGTLSLALFGISFAYTKKF